MTSETARPALDVDVRLGRLREGWRALVAAGVVVVVLAAQVDQAVDLLRATDGLYSAGAADGTFWINAGLAVAAAVLAVALPPRLRWLALVPSATLCAGVLAATATLGGRASAMLMALLVMACAWQLGDLTLRALRVGLLARLVPVAWLAGVGVLGIGIIVFGRFDAIRWWTLGLLVVIVGCVGLLRLARAAWEIRREAASAIVDTAPGTIAVAVMLTALSWGLIYAAAPEIQYDALYAKAWLPHIWATTGEIGPLRVHPVMNNAGLFQVLAVPGHLFGAEAIGRYLQVVAWPSAGAVLWWWGRRHGALGPFAAAAMLLVPHVLWQISTADDDLLLALAALAMTVATLEAIRRGGDAVRIGFVLGLLAGICLSLKFHLAPLAAVLVLGWVIAEGRARRIIRRVGASAAGAVLMGGPPLILRWIDTGNPVLPAFNNVFRSAWWPPINETLNFPFWPHAGASQLLEAPWRAVQKPDLMAEVAPPGAFGLMVAALVIALVVGWSRRRSEPGTLVVWLAIVVSLVFWWMQFRYLRYLLPMAFAAALLVLMGVRVRALGLGGQLVVVALIAATSILFLPSTVASFFNVPNHQLPVSAAVGRWSAAAYEQTVYRERAALKAFDRMAPPGAMAAGDAYQRLWLSDGRDLAPLWELDKRLLVDGPLPEDPDEAFRRWRAAGAAWAILSGTNREMDGPGYLPALLRAHGQIAYADLGWDLYHLVEKPRRPRPDAACDVLLAGDKRCWTAGSLDSTPGLTSVESPGGVSRSVPACIGQTLVVDVTAAPAGAASEVAVDFAGNDPRFGHQAAPVAPGTRERLYATAPLGAAQATITLRPGAGATISRAWSGALGRHCTTS